MSTSDNTEMTSPGGSTPETEETFSARMSETVNSAFTLAGLSIGAKLGLFDAMAEMDTPVTSAQLADKTNCKERYVREWLHQMVMTDIIDVDVSGKNFYLPAHRRHALTEKQEQVPSFGPAFSCMLIPHKEVLSCFRKDGPQGLPFTTVLPFFEEMASKPHKIESMKSCADMLCETVPGLRDKLDAGIRVLEVGSGNGVMLFHLARQFPKSFFTGIDISSDLMAYALTNKADNDHKNTEFFLQDATELPESWHSTFDYVIMRDVLHDIAGASKALKGINDCLKVGGMMSLFEVNVDSNPYNTRQDGKQKQIGKFIYIISAYHCLPASMYHPNSQGLGAGSGIQHIVQLASQAGFTLYTQPQPADWVNVHLMFTKEA